MNLKEVQDWEKKFYEGRGWKDLPPYIRVGFLIEEIGEVSQAVRAYEIGRDHPNERSMTKEEIKQNLSEELGDVLSNVAILADLYHLSLEDIVMAHRNKLTKRYQEQG
ncbi:MAG: MazG-like family protein [Sporolactobacillus sp.]|uniref:MazG-like family protein n=1 Tax=Sporolactobacillus sp. STSJ-5 TaxID=2965076 RepID=UPI002106CF61|nr:MazG-like family protein [Sporolactobacillus sp. STSJ-5]MCQ2010807.1 MazG-like family protein [Sporolactobacillus sp. STSJ-5]